MNRKERRAFNKKIIINIILITIIISAIIILEIVLYKDIIIKENNRLYETTKVIIEKKEIENKEYSIKKKYPKEYIEQKYKGYDVISKLEVPKIDLETYVIKYSENALNISATKFWGCNPNEIGNFCIAAHNFKNKNMFHNLKELNIGDILWIKDNNIGCVEYIIYDIYTVFPNDTRCLLQDTNGNKEVTLITCTNNSKKRIIVKAKEIII